MCARLVANGTRSDCYYGDFFSRRSPMERYYWVSTLYTLLITPKRRRDLSAYFTPPFVSSHLIELLEKYGLRIGHHKILDPASGGAAFLVPLALKLHASAKAASTKDEEVLKVIEQRLSGVELEPGLARLSQLMLEDILLVEQSLIERPLGQIVDQGNSLKSDMGEPEFDAVLCNPPYGRVFRPSARLLARWSEVITDGYVNAYALFIAASLEKVRPGGLVGLVVPTSFLGGPSFAALRETVLSKATVLQLDLIEQRRDVFIDVIQDTCILILKVRQVGVEPQDSLTSTSILHSDGTSSPLGKAEIPTSGRGIWVLPRGTEAVSNTPSEANFFHPSYKTLGDYGYIARCGYFVWNRNRESLTTREAPLPGEFPLIWAHNIRAGEIVKPSSGPRSAININGISWVAVPTASPAIIRTAAIALQRTTNSRQPRRLVAGLVPQQVVDRYGGYVTENHTILVTPITGTEQKVPLETMLEILNSRVVDHLYRRISGSVNVSVKLLRDLPLPSPEALLASLVEAVDIDTALDAAYVNTVAGAISR